MKFLIAILLLSVSVTGFAAIQRHIPDLPPDATSEDYLALQNQLQVDLTDPKKDDGLDEIVAAGVKNLNWLIKINANRPQHLSFTDSAHRFGYPIDAPNRYSPSIILQRYKDFMANAPASFRDAVTSDKELSSNPPSDMKVEDYLTLGRTLDRIYQISTRWRMMEPYRGELAERASTDVRGYYFLSNMADHEAKLKAYATLSAADNEQFTDWLVQMCRNSDANLDACAKELSQSVAAEKGSALGFYKKYVDNAKTHYDSYFLIPDGAARTDIVWDQKTNVATIPFLDPMTEAFRTFMLNVEDEWQWLGWHLKLNFVQKGEVPQLTFQPGTTPHVNTVGGNIITMDQNTPLTDWEVNWTIRHEFGHVLGFLDCYIEFYDEPNKVMLSYQLDLSNLMCSRKGNLKETHYLEMKRNYLK